MATQFEKRKAKSAAEVTREIEEKRSELRAKAAPEVVLKETAYDIFTPDGGKTYKVAELRYNPETGDAKVVEIFNVTRLVALSFENKKSALGILKKKGK